VKLVPCMSLPNLRHGSSRTNLTAKGLIVSDKNRDNSPVCCSGNYPLGAGCVASSIREYTLNLSDNPLSTLTHCLLPLISLL
jgi:hypothetical protein